MWLLKNISDLINMFYEWLWPTKQVAVQMEITETTRKLNKQKVPNSYFRPSWDGRNLICEE